MLEHYLPQIVNSGPWVTAYTLPRLQQMREVDFVLPIGSIGTPYQQFAGLGDLVLPPLFHEALSVDLKQAMIARISDCFPSYGGAESGRFRVVELPRRDLPETDATDLLALSIDTAVEEHGPHLPLGTDTIQSYSVLRQLSRESPQIELARPLEYGQLTWGLPFGFSVDLTADLLASYVTNYVNALVRWKRPRSLYVVDVHGSMKHRSAIVQGLEAADFSNWAFRWLHEPLVEFASQRGDQHAGGVETVLVQRAGADLLDPAWWPERIEEIAAGQMPLELAVELTPDLEAFARHVREHSCNGVVGDIYNYRRLDAEDLFERMMTVARADVAELIRGNASQDPGEQHW